MSVRTRITIVITATLVLLGIGVGAQADTVNGGINTTKNNGCIVVPSAQLAVCIARF